MAPAKKNPSKKTSKTTKSKKRRSNDCCATSSSSSSSYDSSSESSETSSETDSTDSCDCSDSDCSDCWECEVKSKKRGGKRSKGNVAYSKAAHKGKKKPAPRRGKFKSSCDNSSCETSDDCYDCVPKKPGRKART